MKMLRTASLGSNSIGSYRKKKKYIRFKARRNPRKNLVYLFKFLQNSDYDIFYSGGVRLITFRPTHICYLRVIWVMW